MDDRSYEDTLLSALNEHDIAYLQDMLTPRLTKYIPYDPTPKQRAFLLMNRLKEVLYGGAAGGGKSVAQLMGALQFVDIPGYSAILFRKTYAVLALPGALIDMSKQWLMPFVESKEVHWSEKEKKYTFPSGATVSFGYLENANDCYRYQGTANPGGEFGEYYYQRFFIDGPSKGRVFIPAGLDDNPYLDDEAYREALDELDPIERERLLNGNWEIKQQGDLFNRHWFQIVPVNSVPDAAQRVRFWDLAATDPKKKKNKSRSGQREPDYTVGFKLAKYQGMYWVEDIYRDQISPKEAERVIHNTAVSDGFNCAIRMEQEPGSSGAVTIDKYQREVLTGYNFLGVTSTGSKVERARSASAASEGGLVLVSDHCHHILDFFDEADLFPYGMHDDTIDAFSGAFNYFRPGGVLRAPTAIKKSSGSYWSKFRS